MPTTLSSLLIFVVLLLPGFAYLVGKSVTGPSGTLPRSGRLSLSWPPVCLEAAVLVMFAVLRWLRPVLDDLDVGADPPRSAMPQAATARWPPGASGR